VDQQNGAPGLRNVFGTFPWRFDWKLLFLQTKIVKHYTMDVAFILDKYFKGKENV
jgi:hypothetical protein